MTKTVALAAVFPDVSVATAVSMCVPLVIPTVFQLMLYPGPAPLTVVPKPAPSKKNCTLAIPAPSVALADTGTVPLTDTPFTGAVTATVGAIVSVPIAGPKRNHRSRRPLCNTRPSPGICTLPSRRQKMPPFSYRQRLAIEDNWTRLSFKNNFTVLTSQAMLTLTVTPLPNNVPRPRRRCGRCTPFPNSIAEGQVQTSSCARQEIEQVIRWVIVSYVEHIQINWSGAGA